MNTMKKVTAAITTLILLVSMMTVPMSAVAKSAVHQREDASISSLFDFDPGVKVHLKTYADKESRTQAYAGPGKLYAGAGGYKPYVQGDYIAFFREGDYVFVRLNYAPNKDRYCYFAASEFKSLTGVYIESSEDLPCFYGVTLESVLPSWGLGREYTTQNNFKISANTNLQVFFEENGYVYAEFVCEMGNVRIWLPLEKVMVDPEQETYIPLTRETSVTAAAAYRHNPPKKDAKQEKPVGRDTGEEEDEDEDDWDEDEDWDDDDEDDDEDDDWDEDDWDEDDEDDWDDEE